MKRLLIAFVCLVSVAMSAYANPMSSEQAYKLLFPESMFENYDLFQTYTGTNLICYSEDNTYMDIYDTKTGKLKKTISWEDLLDTKEPEAYVEFGYGDLCLIHYYSDELPYGINALMDIMNGELIWVSENYSSQRESYYYYNSFWIDGEKLTMLGTYNYKDETGVQQSKHVISMLYYKTGELIEPAFTVENEDYKYTLSYSRIVDCNKNFIAVRYQSPIETYGEDDGIAVYNIEEKTVNFIDDAYYLYYIEGRHFLTNDGQIIRKEWDSEVEYEGDFRAYREQLVKINPTTGAKTIIHTDSVVGDLINVENNKQYLPTSHIGDFSYDSSTGDIYFLETIGIPEITVNRLFRKDEYIKVEGEDGKKTNKLKTSFETKPEPAYGANGSPFLYAYDIDSGRWRSYVTNYHKYNLFRISDKGGEAVPLSNDFFYTYTSATIDQRLKAKKGNLLIETKFVSHDSVSFPSSELTINEDCLNSKDYYCSECECTSLNLLPETRPEIAYRFAVVSEASTKEAYTPMFIVEPVLPATCDGESKVKEGADYVRTYQVKNGKGEPISGATVVSASGRTSTSGKKGMVSISNLAKETPGTYEGKTIDDVINSISYGGKKYAFHLNNKKGGLDSFKLIVEPGGIFEKRYDLELGGSVSGGIGAFRFGTIKAATIDLEASVASGIYFNIVDEEGERYLEMGRSLNAGVGANAVLAEAQLKGGFSAGAGAGLKLLAVGQQVFKTKDPFKSENASARAVTTAFIWDTLVKNGTLAFPSVGLIINWIWDNVRGDGLLKSMEKQSAGLQVSGDVSAGVDIPALEVASGGAELSGSNLSNLGLSLPSVSGGFVLEGLLHEYKNTEENIGVEVSVSTAMNLDKGIFDGVYDYTGLPEIPGGHNATFGLQASFDKYDKPHTIYLNYDTEQDSGNRIKVSETELSLDADQLMQNISLLPETIQNITKRENVGNLSWDTKSLGKLYRETVHAAGKGVSGNFKTFTDMVDDATYEFEVGLGVGLNFGVGARFSYLEYERTMDKRYRIDSLSEGMALVEDWTYTTPRFASEGMKDIMGLTLEYLKDKVKEIYTTVVKKVESGIETGVQSGNAIVDFATDLFKKRSGGAYEVHLTTFTPLSSTKNSASRMRNVPFDTITALAKFAALDSSSASIGEAALLNVVDNENNMVEDFSAGTLTLGYTSSEIDNAGLKGVDENKFFIWKYRSSDRKHEKLSGAATNLTEKTLRYDNLTKNGTYGIGYDETAPEIEIISPESGKSLYTGQKIVIRIMDDFSGVDMSTILVKINEDKIVGDNNVNEMYNPSTGYLTYKIGGSSGENVLSITVSDTAGNENSVIHSFTNDSNVDPLDYDGDGVANYMDKFPLDPQYWKDEDNDGTPDDIDENIIVSGAKTCSCGNIKFKPNKAVDFSNSYVTFDQWNLILHNIAVLVNDEYQYYWTAHNFNFDSGGFEFTGFYGVESGDPVQCNCGLRKNDNNGDFSLINSYGEMNYGNRLTIHDFAIKNKKGLYDYFWFNVTLDLNTLNFYSNGEFGLE